MSIISLAPLVFYFSDVEDSRSDNKRHLLLAILVIAICGAICGSDT